MSVRGRINIDIVFHDYNNSIGSLKVVDLESNETVESGKVAILTGTHGSSSHSINTNSPGYVDSSGSPVSFSQVTRIGLKASRPMKLADNQGHVVIRSDGDRAAFSECDESGNLTLTPLYASGTGSYTIFMYGT